MLLSENLCHRYIVRGSIVVACQFALDLWGYLFKVEIRFYGTLERVQIANGVQILSRQSILVHVCNHITNLSFTRPAARRHEMLTNGGVPHWNVVQNDIGLRGSGYLRAIMPVHVEERGVFARGAALAQRCRKVNNELISWSQIFKSTVAKVGWCHHGMHGMCRCQLPLLVLSDAHVKQISLRDPLRSFENSLEALLVIPC
mmetsp:Transcript_359/g.1346  ORF Transcript_359/g.1346 Transcript_359/m.1346 type:complete len:201 (+) Transcript_359:346-948(+)